MVLELLLHYLSVLLVVFPCLLVVVVVVVVLFVCFMDQADAKRMTCVSVRGGCKID